MFPHTLGGIHVELFKSDPTLKFDPKLKVNLSENVFLF